MTVREAQTEDAGAIARILHSVDWLWAAQQPLEQLQAGAERFLKAVGDTPTSTVLIAQPDNVGVGFVAFHLYPAVRAAYEGYVSHLFVHADARGQGIGGQLLAAAEREAAVYGCFRLHLYINRQRPAYQRQFYEKAGWQEHETASLFVRHIADSSKRFL